MRDGRSGEGLFKEAEDVITIDRFETAGEIRSRVDISDLLHGLKGKERDGITSGLGMSSDQRFSLTDIKLVEMLVMLDGECGDGVIIRDLVPEHLHAQGRVLDVLDDVLDTLTPCVIVEDHRSASVLDDLHHVEDPLLESGDGINKGLDSLVEVGEDRKSVV